MKETCSIDQLKNCLYGNVKIACVVCLYVVFCLLPFYIFLEFFTHKEKSSLQMKGNKFSPIISAYSKGALRILLRVTPTTKRHMRFSIILDDPSECETNTL